MDASPTDTGLRRRFGGVLRWNGMPAEVALGLPDRLDALVERGVVLKGGAGDRGVVVRLEPLWPGGPPLVLKRYHPRGVAYAAAHAAIPSHAARSWAMVRRLAAAGLRTPHVFAMGESRAGPLRGTSWFLAAFVAARTLREILDDAELPAPRLAALAAEVRRVFDVLATLRLRHRDVKLANFLVEEPGDRLVLIDLDGMRGPHPPVVFERLGPRDVRRFLANFPAGSSRRDAFAAALGAGERRSR